MRKWEGLSGSVGDYCTVVGGNVGVYGCQMKRFWDRIGRDGIGSRLKLFTRVYRVGVGVWRDCGCVEEGSLASFPTVSAIKQLPLQLSDLIATQNAYLHPIHTP